MEKKPNEAATNVNEKYNIMLEEMYHAGSGRCEDILEKYHIINRYICGVPYSILNIGELEIVKPDSEDMYEVGARDIKFTRVTVGIYNDDLFEEFIIPFASGMPFKRIIGNIEDAYNEWMIRKRLMLGSNWNEEKDNPFYKREEK